MVINVIRHGKRFLSTTNRKIRNLIKQHTEISNDHLTPEIPLHLITPSCKLWTSTDHDNIPFCDPYWAFYWPGGQAVARYLLDNPKVVLGQSVIDVGSGSGACAIAAAKAGARMVTANDIDPVAGEAILLNASMNHVNINVSLDNQVGRDCIEWDVILLGDMLYDREYAEILQVWIKEMKNSGKMILIGDPGREPMKLLPKENLMLMASFDLPPQANLENRGFSTAFVWSIL